MIRVRKNEDELLPKKLNKMFRDMGRDVRASFYGSQMNHDQPYTHAIEFSRELTVTEIERVSKILKRWFKRRWWHLSERYITYAFCSRKDFENASNSMSIDIMHTMALDSIEEVEQWFQDYSHPYAVKEECQEALEHLETILEYIQESGKMLKELMK